MKLFIDFYKRQGYDSSYLRTTNELDTAAALYTKHGYSLTEEIPTSSFGKELVERRYELIKQN